MLTGCCSLFVSQSGCWKFRKLKVTCCNRGWRMEMLHQNREKWAALSFETNAFKWSRSFIPLSIIIGRGRFVTSKVGCNFWYCFQLLIPVPHLVLKTAIGCFHWNKLGEGDTISQHRNGLELVCCCFHHV